MRLIDADAVLKVPNVNWVHEFDETGTSIRYKAVPAEVIEKAPTVEAEPVRHGEWVETKLRGIVACSACGLERHKSLNLGAAWRFCPKCGAKEDGGKKDG